MNTKTFVKAVDVEETIAYQPEVRPGYTAWVNLFPGNDDRLFMSFLEIKKQKNPNFEPASIEFFEAMGLAIKIGDDLMGKSTPDFVFEYPMLRSDEFGKNWEEIGRAIVFDRHFWICTLPDGSLLRAHGVNAYRYDLGDKRNRAIVSKSEDGGKSWKELSCIAEDCFFYIHRLKVLRDGTVIVAGSLQASFGHGGSLPQRTSMPRNVENKALGAFFLSYDYGKTWQAPQTIFPGEVCWEPDFVELPSGDLLFVNSTSQCNRNTRQYFYKRKNGYFPSPVINIKTESHFIVPETIVMTDDGLIVGARREQGVPESAAYTCSNDEGETWHVIDGLPRCLYQPMIQKLKDGRIICASHLGGDSRYGEFDMNITTHTFRIEGTLPDPTYISLSRNLSSSKAQYTNSFSAILTSGKSPLANKNIEFRVLEKVSREDYQDIRECKDVKKRGDTFKAVTDINGKAILNLPEYNKIMDASFPYMVQVLFLPDTTDFLPTESTVLCVHALTPKRNKENNYDIYYSSGILWVAKDILSEYEEIRDIITNFTAKGIEFVSKKDIINKLEISSERASKIISILEKWNIFLPYQDKYVFNPVRMWSALNNPVNIKEVKEICVFDHFV